MADGLTLKIDLTGIAEKLKAKFQTIANPEYVLRPVAFDLIALMTERIHDKGLGSDGSLIKAGGYDSGYLKFRQEKHNRTADKKVIISLTRQLENDWSVIQIKGGYGIGFKNSFNYQKAQWMHDIFGDRVFRLSASERQYATKRFNELVSDQFNS